MRPLLITDGAHLKGTYKGTNLVLVGMDGNNQIIPIGTGEVPNLEIIMDKHSAIILACNMISQMHFTAYTLKEFQRRISDLRGLRLEAYKKLEDAGFETWSRAMCPANRYNYMTSNNAESINNLTRHVRKAPITMLMEWYRVLLQKWYCARREKYQDSPVHTISDWATHKVMHRMQKSANWKVYGIHQAVGRVMGCTDCSDMTLESNIHNNFGGRSHQYEAAYSNNYERSHEYVQAYNNMIGRSQEYEPAYTNNYKRSQEYSPAYNNNNGRSQEYEAAYNNINFSGMAQDPHPIMPFAFNQFNFGQTSQQTDSSMPFTWDPINLAEA
ncbi:hypothetical protein Tco_0719345 [Tanacetum coccineum]